VKIIFVTSNEGKVAEFSALMAPLGHEVEQLDCGYPEVQADTLDEVARAGLEHLKTERGGPLVLEDAGLFIDALKGFPGVYSNYALRTLGNPGILKLMDGIEHRNARFEAALGFLDESGEAHIFKGSCPGSIGVEMKGTGGFGFDPIFIPEGHGRSFAEMTVEEKGVLSHRGRAGRAFAEWLAGR